MESSDTAQSLLQLVDFCQSRGYALELEYDNGRYIEVMNTFDEQGNHIPPEKQSPENIKQRATGFRINIGGYALESLHSGNEEMLYPSLAEAVLGGWSIVRGIA